jgi:hypothetical protein
VQIRAKRVLCGSLHRHESPGLQFSGNHLIDVAPNPFFPRFDGTHQRMLTLVEMLGCVLVLGGVATPNLSALQAHPQMNPCISRFNALFTHVLIRAGNPDLIEV